MSRLIIAAVVIAVALTVYAVIDCAMTDAKRTRALSKPVWLLVVLVVPVVGAVLWILFGKGLLLKTTSPSQSAPDDDEAFLRSLGADAAHDERIRTLEAELRALDEQLASGDTPADPRDVTAADRGDDAPSDPAEPDGGTATLEAPEAETGTADAPRADDDINGHGTARG